MKRDLERLANQDFDILVVGGGIHGAIAAWDAALRGLSVGIIERGDFGCATSQNSLKVIHGGLRYLQDADLARIRMMTRERSAWLKIAPHLVHPLPCLTPTYPKLSRSRLAMGAALKLNDLIGYDRNRLLDEDNHLPAGRILSKDECAQYLPGLDMNGLSGAALWYDAQMYSSERLLLEFVLSANQAGAAVANYVEAIGLIHRGEAVIGAQVRDVLTGQEFIIRSKVMINSTGAWINRLLETLGKPAPKPIFNPSIALNLIVRQVWDKVAAGLPSRPGRKKEGRGESQRSQMFFIVPWRGKSIIGTWHIPWPHSLDAFQVTDTLIQEFMDEINSAHPGLNLSLDDILHVHWGFLPMENTASHYSRVNLTREGNVIDHQAEDGWAGLISMLGVKYTTSRAVAEKAVDLAVKKLGLETLECQTSSTPVMGGQGLEIRKLLAQAPAQAPTGLDLDIIEHLVYTYGSQYKELLDYVAEQPAFGDRLEQGSPVIVAQVIHAVRQELALTLGDVILRRTELGAAGLPELPVLQNCVELMGLELGWDVARQTVEIDTLIQNYPFQRRERALA